MPDHRQHRGPHPHDAELFGSDAVALLRSAAADLGWLRDRGYPEAAALKLVGDRYALRQRQRQAVARAVCTAGARQLRVARRTPPDAVAGQPLWIDGFNVLTTVEAALAGGALLDCADGCLRDMASMHGSYRRVAETLPAIELTEAVLARLRPAAVRWLLDAPVSNSGRLRAYLLDTATRSGWPWEVELVPDPDAVLKSATAIVATADSAILDAGVRSLDLARLVVAEVPGAWIVDLAVNEGA